MRLGTSIPTLKVGSTAIAAIKRGAARVYDADVAAFQQASNAADVTGILDLVDYLKAQSLWNYARFYPMKSAQNAGTGSTVYGLGGLTSNNMTLVNSPTWGSDGVTFNGSTQYGEMPSASDFEFDYTDSFSWFSVAKTTSAGTQAILGKQDVIAGFATGYSSLLLTGDRVDLQSQSGVALSETTTAAFSTGQFITRAFSYAGSESPSSSDLRVFVGGEEAATSVVSDTLNASITTAAKFRIAGRGHSTVQLPMQGTIAIVCGVSVAISDLQRETITDLINAL